MEKILSVLAAKYGQSDSFFSAWGGVHGRSQLASNVNTKSRGQRGGGEGTKEKNTHNTILRTTSTRAIEGWGSSRETGKMRK